MYEVWGRYVRTGIEECLDSATGRGEAERLVTEYRMAFGPDWTIWIKDTEWTCDCRATNEVDCKCSSFGSRR